MMSTINSRVEYKGIGLHNGKAVNVILDPAPVNHGITINDLTVSPPNITKTIGMTTHGNVDQTEHLLSALYALGIDNIKVTIDGTEFPIMDGGSREIIDTIMSVGIKRFNVTRPIWHPTEEVYVESGDSYAKYSPNLNPDDLSTTFKYIVDFPYVGIQEYYWDGSNYSDYYDNIAPCKTFFYDTQLESELLNNRCKGYMPNVNCYYLEKGVTMQNNELAKHKLLDLVGDVHIFNLHIPGRFLCYKAGHKLHNELMSKMYQLKMKSDI